MLIRETGRGSKIQAGDGQHGKGSLQQLGEYRRRIGTMAGRQLPNAHFERQRGRKLGDDPLADGQLPCGLSRESFLHLVGSALVRQRGHEHTRGTYSISSALHRASGG